MKHPLRSVVLALLLVPAASGQRGQTIGFEETFALADDRGAVLQQLVPGSQEHFFYTCLHLQQIGDLDGADAMIERWSEVGGSPALRQIEARQALLRASTDPERTYAFLEKELGLRFDDRRDSPEAVTSLPSSFDQAPLGADAFVQQALRRADGRGLSGLSRELQRSLLAGPTLTDGQRGALLDLLEWPDVPGLVPAIEADLDANPESTFGARRIHGRLLLAQLEELRRRRPELASNRLYVETVLRRLAPADGASLEDQDVRETYLERALAFADQLPSAFDSVKAHLLYHRLVLDLDRGTPDRARFMRYLRLPRQASYLELDPQQRAAAANLGDDVGGATRLPAIGDDEGVVRDLLEALLRGESGYGAYVGVLPERFVQRAWARTQLLYGGDPDQADLIEMLGGPAEAEALRNLVEVRFERTNPDRFAAGDDVSLAVRLKNVESVLIKVFRVDPSAYFDLFGRSVATDINLDGLVTNDEFVVELDAPPMRRVERSIDLPALDAPGTYVVELIGGGVASRAVVRKGRLDVLERIGAAGHLFEVLDGDRRPVEGAVIRFGERDFVAGEDGLVRVPFTSEQQERRVLVRAGGLSRVTSFLHRTESYALRAATHLAAEALLEGNRARVVVRPRLTLNGQRLPLERVDELALEIEAIDFEGAYSASRVDDLRASSAGLLGAEAAVGVLAADIQVPQRLDRVRVRLVGAVRRATDGERVSLSTPWTVTSVNDVARGRTVGQALLRRDPGAFTLELRGRNGEPLGGRAVRVEAQTRHSSRTVAQELRSDERGHVDLGALEAVTRIEVSGDGIARNDWTLGEAEAFGLPSSLRATVGTVLRVPFAGEGPLRPADVSLVELRAEQPTADRFDALRLEPGYLAIEGLGQGSYALRVNRSGITYRVEVEDGVVRSGHVVTRHRALPLSNPTPLSIRDVTQADGSFSLRLGGSSPATRVVVLGSRYQGQQDPAEDLGLPHTSGRSDRILAAPRTVYDSGRTISEEYRYILNRRLQDVFPGNMLPRASLLLNPWVLSETTDRMDEELEMVNELLGLGGGAGGKFGGRRGGRARKSKRGVVPSLDLDFLGRPATVAVGLQPDDQGVVTVPMAGFEDLHHFRVVAFDGAVTASREVLRKPRPVRLRDRRLAAGLDPSAPMTQQRRIRVLRAGDVLELRDAPNADAQTFQTLGDVFRLYATMLGPAGGAQDSGIEAFEFITRWPDLAPAERRALYSRYACHELNVFLSRKDPAFFQDVVAPYLANKGARTFLDDWLLGADLAGYLEPWRYQGLNAVERILLLRRVGLDAGQAAADLLATMPRGSFSLDRDFAQILASRGIDDGGSGLNARLAEVRKQSAGRPAPPSGGGGGGGGPASPGPTGPSAPAAGAPVTGGLAQTQDSLRSLGYADGSDDFFLGRRLGDKSVDRGREARSRAEAGEEEVTETSEGEVVADFEVEGLYFAKNNLEDVRALYRELDPTRAYAETHYWRVPRQAMRYDLIPISPFWADLAVADGPFQSAHFSTATRSLSEALLALAFLDLPFEAAESEVEVDGRSLRLTVGSPALVALEDIAPTAAEPEGQQRILVGQDFFELARPKETVDGVERDRFITGEFLAGVPYGCRMVLSNTSSAPVELVALVQIPEGAMPVDAHRVTDGRKLVLPAYGTTSIETAFYFPAAGDFADYPVHAGQGEVLLGAAPARRLRVVDQLSEVDRSTWDWVSQNGSVEDVVAFLAAGNPFTLDLQRVAWRMNDPEAFAAITGALAARQVSAPILERYAVKLRDDAGTRRFLSTNQRLLGRVQAPFRSPLYSVDAVERGLYEHLAFEPLVRGRTHQVGAEREILNDEYAAQYRSFLRRLTLGSGLTDSDRMELAYYLLLQNRIGEALAAFDRVDPDGVDMALQYDYMTAYMDFYRGDVAHAREVASRHTEHPVDRWRQRFQGVIAQLDEIESGTVADAEVGSDRDAAQGALAATEPILEFEVEGDRLRLSHERVPEVEVRYHLMDVEFLFSANPFVRGEVGQSSLIEPNRVEVVSLDGADRSTAIPLPADLARSNLFVEVRGAGISRRATYFSSRLTVQGLERYGQLRVVGNEDQRPIPKAYVKVYGMTDAGVRFIKDGYTDLRGRFDYASVSGYEGPPVTRYSVLVLHEEAGATITELSPPIR
ncbi:MAG: hypothetical protein PVJ89_06925 [Planctomycetota bacterium]|jgi:hypothetical protein